MKIINGAQQFDVPDVPTRYEEEVLKELNTELMEFAKSRRCIKCQWFIKREDLYDECGKFNFYYHDKKLNYETFGCDDFEAKV